MRVLLTCMVVKVGPIYSLEMKFRINNGLLIENGVLREMLCFVGWFNKAASTGYSWYSGEFQKVLVYILCKLGRLAR